MDVPQLPLLTQDETDVVNDVLYPKSNPLQANAEHLKPVRAEFLHRLILGLELQPDPNEPPRIIPIPTSGLKLRYLHITDDSADPTKPCDETGVLHLEDACGPNGVALPPLELEHCLFPKTIHMSRARFRRLSLKGSFLVHLCANGIRIEGPLDLSGVTSAEDLLGLPKTGAELAGAAGSRPLAVEMAREQPTAFQPGEAAGDEDQRIPQGLCWVEMQNAEIEDELDASKSRFVAPPDRNSSLARSDPRYALHLAGSRIGGLFRFGPAAESRGSTEPVTALGGISISRCRIHRSTIGSGAVLLAVEGAALIAQGAELFGNVSLDYDESRVPEGRCFHATGYVDLRDAVVRASLTMRGAELKLGPRMLGGLLAQHLEVLDGCYLDAFQFSDRARVLDTEPIIPFSCEGGIYLADSNIGGDFVIRGARLSSSSPDNHALYAPGLTVNGEALFTGFSGYAAAFGKRRRAIPFCATGVIEIAGATFKKSLNMQGAILRVPKGLGDRELLDGSGMTVGGSLILGTVMGNADYEPRVFRFTSEGSLRLESINVGVSLLMSGALLRSSRSDGAALILAGANIRADALFDAYDISDESKAGALRFLCFGSIEMQGASIQNCLMFQGAFVRGNATGSVPAINANGAVIGLALQFDPFQGVQKNLRKTFRSRSGLLLVGSEIGAFLRLQAAQIEQGNCVVAIDLSLSSVRAIGAEGASIQGTVILRDTRVTSGMSAKELVVVDGSLDFGGAWLRSLDLSGLVMQFTRPDFPVNYLDCSYAHIENRLSIDTTFRLKASSLEAATEALPPLWADLRGLQVGDLEDQHGWGWGKKVRLRLDGFTLARMPTRRVGQLTFKAAQDEVQAGFREARLELLLRAKGTQRRPERFWSITEGSVPRRGFTGGMYNVFFGLRVLSDEAGWSKVALFFGLCERPFGRLYRFFHVADAHIDWLDRQYATPKRPSKEEYTPSAYDQLAQVLREEGHDTEAKRITSAKLSVKRKVDVPIYARPAWFLYHRLFDYGLTARYAFLTYLLCLLLGAFGIRQALYSHVRSEGHHGLAGTASVLVVTTGAVNTVAFAGDADSQDTSEVGVARATGPLDEEVPCKPGRVDPLLYATELFVPALDLGQTKLCEISAAPAAWPWRWGRALYGILGWIVTSITVLTVPGILRSRAEG